MSVKDFEDERWRHSPQKLEFRHRAALAFISKGPVLDIGCGDGLFLSLCKEKGIEAEGIDFSDVAVSRCTERGLKAHRVDIATGLPFADNAFPVVVALDVLEHVYEPGKLLREIKRISSGTVIVGVPNFSSLPARLQVLLGEVPENNRPHKGHIYWFNWPVLRTMAEKNGLRIVARRANAPWERIPLIGMVSRALAAAFPNLFSLSFIIQAQKTATV